MSLKKDDILDGIEVAAQRMGLDNEDLLEMIGDVIEDCIEKVVLIREAGAAGNADQVSAVAHDIKGSTINYGLEAPSAIAKEIELGKLEAIDRVDALSDVLEQIKAMDIGV